jgi:hypothetical protein
VIQFQSHQYLLDQIAVPVAATPTTLMVLNNNHQPSFKETALNYKAASLIVATTNKLILSSQL